MNNDILVTREVICQSFSLVTNSWKSLANHPTRDQIIVIQGNSCIILYISFTLTMERQQSCTKSLSFSTASNYNPQTSFLNIHHQVWVTTAANERLAFWHQTRPTPRRGLIRDWWRQLIRTFWGGHGTVDTVHCTSWLARLHSWGVWKEKFRGIKNEIKT